MYEVILAEPTATISNMVACSKSRQTAFFDSISRFLLPRGFQLFQGDLRGGTVDPSDLSAGFPARKRRRSGCLACAA